MLKILSYLIPRKYAPTFLFRFKKLDPVWDLQLSRHNRKAIKEIYGRYPVIGDLIEDCRYQVHKIVEINLDNDTVILDDGASCSLLYCCSWPPNKSLKER